jgi:polygalacturonase
MSRSTLRSVARGLALSVSLGRAAANAQTPAVSPVAGRVYDVRAFGAKGDSASLDTDAINRAIAAAAAAGGGTVYIGPGIYSSFSIHLRSHVTLYLERGATLFAASPDERPASPGYDPAEPGPGNEFQDYGHSHWHNSLIWGENVEDVAIVGSGRIDGYGMSRAINRDTPRAGNKAIALLRVRHVLLRDFTIYRGAHFGVLATGVDNLTIDNLTIDTNRDGIDIDACRNVRISNISVNSPADDAIVLKSSYGLGEARATENVTITNSIVSGYEIGSMLDATFKPYTAGPPNRDGPTGRVKLGTESNGAFRNIAISNIVFDESRGLALETVDGATLEDVVITNLTMRHVWTSPIFVRLGARMRGPPGTAVGSVRRVTISNVVASDADPRYASTITGIPGHPVQDVTLSNIRITYRGGLTLAQAARQPRNLVRSRAPGDTGQGRADAYDVPEQQNAYPEPSMFGLVPAYGFYVRHVAGIKMDDVDVSFTEDERRPAFVLDDVRDAEFHRVSARKSATAPTFVLRDVAEFRTLHSRPVPDTYVRSAKIKVF